MIPELSSGLFCGIAVDYAAAVAGQFETGALVTLKAAGEGPEGCTATGGLFLLGYGEPANHSGPIHHTTYELLYVDLSI